MGAEGRAPCSRLVPVQVGRLVAALRVPSALVASAPPSSQGDRFQRRTKEQPRCFPVPVSGGSATTPRPPVRLGGHSASMNKQVEPSHLSKGAQPAWSSFCAHEEPNCSSPAPRPNHRAASQGMGSCGVPAGSRAPGRLSGTQACPGSLGERCPLRSHPRSSEETSPNREYGQRG